MKIALISHEYPPDSIGGIGSQTHIKAHNLSALGHEVYVICPSGNNTRYRYMDKKVHVVRTLVDKKFKKFALDMIAWSMSLDSEINLLHKKIKFDIIDFPEVWNQGFTFLLNRTESHNNIPCVIQLHSSLIALSKNLGWPNRSSELFEIGTALEASTFRLADQIYSSSRHSAQECIKYYGLKNKNIPVIHTGIDTSLFYPHEANNKTGQTIIFVARLAGAKGIENLVIACGKLIKEFPHLKLKIIGEEHQDGVILKLKRIAEEAHMSDVLEFYGHVDRLILPRIFNDADIFALPSFYEGGPGFAYLEAMACGLPVIGCTNGGMSEVIKNGKNGFLIPAQNTDRLVSVLRTLLSDKKLRERIGKNARAYVVKNAETKNCLKDLASFYKSVIHDFGRNNKKYEEY